MSQPLPEQQGVIMDANSMTDKQGKFQSLNSQSYITSKLDPTLLNQNYKFDGFNIPKIPCLYHKGNILTNFCKCLGCLLPLCPQCVEEHILKHKEERTQNMIECLETVLNDIYREMSKEANDFARSYFDLVSGVENMKYTTDNTINKLEDIKNRIIKIVEQFFNSLKIDIENKQQKNKENQKRDAELLKSLVQERWSSHITLLETLNSEKSMTSVIHYYGTSTLSDNQKYFEVLNEYSNRFEQVTSDIIFYQDRGIDIAAHLSHIVKIRHNDVPEFIQIHTLPNPNIKDAISLQPKQISRIAPSTPLYPAIRASPFIPPSPATSGAQRLLNSGTFFSDGRYTDQLNRLPQYSQR